MEDPSASTLTPASSSPPSRVADFTRAFSDASSLNLQSPPSTGQLNLAGAGGADWVDGPPEPQVTDNRHIVIPLMSFVFGFPVLVITILCVIQQRNKWLYERQHMRLQQQRRFSTASTIFTGFPSTSRALTGSFVQHKDVTVFGHGRNSVVFNAIDSPSSADCSHRNSLTLQALQQNGMLQHTGVSNGHGQGLGGQGQRSRKQSAIRFTDTTVVDDDDVHPINNNNSNRLANYLHPNHSQNHARSPLLNVGPQNILDKFGYVDG